MQALAGICSVKPGVKKNNDPRRILAGVIIRRREMTPTPQLKKNGFILKKTDPGFCLIYMKKNDPVKNDPCRNIEKLYLRWIEKASQCFDLIHNRDIPNTRVDL